MLLQQLVHGRLVSIFTHHGASSFSPPLLSIKGPLFSEMDSAAEMMDRNGAIVVLPSDHRVRKRGLFTYALQQCSLSLSLCVHRFLLLGTCAIKTSPT